MRHVREQKSRQRVVRWIGVATPLNAFEVCVQIDTVGHDFPPGIQCATLPRTSPATIGPLPPDNPPGFAVLSAID
jgi:hypothetical protein